LLARAETLTHLVAGLWFNRAQCYLLVGVFVGPLPASSPFFGQVGSRWQHVVRGRQSLPKLVRCWYMQDPSLSGEQARPMKTVNRRIALARACGRDRRLRWGVSSSLLVFRSSCASTWRSLSTGSSAGHLKVVGDGSMYSQAMVSPALMHSLGFALVESEPCPCDRQLEKS
jgi:hypothetical protein